ncbi:MAG: CAP domain-containing protein [Verrucomicrobiota bacterium]
MNHISRIVFTSFCLALSSVTVADLVEVKDLEQRFWKNSGFQIDSFDREQVRSFFRFVYAASEGIDPQWTGSFDRFNPGSTSDRFKRSVITRINFYRAMAGVPADVEFRSENSESAQEAAWVMSYNGELSHYPQRDEFKKVSKRAEIAALSSNLSLGSFGAEAITEQMQDNGQRNQAVGHRRTLLDPRTRFMGTGDVKGNGDFASTNALWVFDDSEERAERIEQTRDPFVAWPPKGYVPYQLVFPRWSFSIQGADFSEAEVTVSEKGKLVPVTISDREETFVGLNSIVFTPFNLLVLWDDPNLNDRWSKPEFDRTFSITVSNVKDAPQDTYTYQVIVFDPDTSETSGVPQILRDGEDGNYTVVRDRLSSSYQILKGETLPANMIWGAEEDGPSVSIKAQGDYAVLSNLRVRSGERAYHLAHMGIRDEIFELEETLVPSVESVLSYYEFIGPRSVDQVREIQVSVDGGQNWKSLYSEADEYRYITERPMELRSQPLGDYADRMIRIRFCFFFDGGSFHQYRGDGFKTSDLEGWFIDDIRISNAHVVEELKVYSACLQSKFVSGSDAQSRGEIIAVRPVYFQSFPGMWAPVEFLAPR